MRRILTLALLAAVVLAATVPVSLVTAGKAEARGRGTFTETTGPARTSKRGR